MSTPGEYYRSLPPVSKAYGVICLLTTSAYYLQLYDAHVIYLSYTRVIKHLQIWRLITNFFFLGPFSPRFGMHFLMIARYWVLLERGAFDKRTADFLWMTIFGALSLLGFYLPWAFLALDLIFGAPLKPDILGIVAGHLYYFLSVLYPLSGRRNILKTPVWVHKVVMFWGEGVQVNSPVPVNPSAGVAFRGRSYRLNQ
ncbi:derlin-1.2-like isoform X2 [Magnolia sinica]|uniref:derlin-1.2-like isoform X2 n=1 Tax=Magnolia sinica TaxID=86752 RepID=UPI00265A23D0|nr:derlin-1.2-like isoform X2 [Magnolia sinica]